MKVCVAHTWFRNYKLWIQAERHLHMVCKQEKPWRHLVLKFICENMEATFKEYTDDHRCHCPTGGSSLDVSAAALMEESDGAHEEQL